MSAPRFGWLCDADTCERIRHATRAEYRASVAEARVDGGAGIIPDPRNEARLVYVEGGSP